MMPNLSACETAMELLGRHLWPIPLYPLGIEISDGDEFRITTGKEPIGKAWGRSRPTEAKLRATFQAHPEAGVGIRLGLDGGVIDLEVDGPDGTTSLGGLLGRKATTLGWSSRRGPHHLFQFEPRFLSLKRSTFKLPKFPGLEIRIGVNGAQLHSACPPTVGLDGNLRRWNEHSSIARLPEPAIERLLDLATKPAQSYVGEIAVPASVAGITYGAEALSRECELVAKTAAGTRHDTLRDAALRIASLAKSGVLAWEYGRRQLADSASRSGLSSPEIRDVLDWAWVHAKSRMIHMSSLGRGEREDPLYVSNLNQRGPH